MGRAILVLLVVFLVLAPVASAGHMEWRGASQRVITADVSRPCPGDPISADRVIQGRIGADRLGGYVLVPFRVPAGTTAVRVKYCFDRPEEQRFLGASHRLDLGLYEARRRPGALYGTRESLGWGGFSHHDVTISAEGFSSEREYRRDPAGHVEGRTTRGFRPTAIRPGEWAAELGVANVVRQLEGDETGEVAWRVEVELSRDPRFADRPYRPKRFDSRRARLGPGWFTGDLHVHGEHSTLGDAPMREIFDYAFGRGGPRLDFLTLSDHNNDSAWSEIARLQGRYPGKLVIRSSEIITYRGHAMNHGSGRLVEYRTGPIWERRPDGSLRRRRGARPPRRVFDDVHAAGGFTQVAHAVNFDDPATRAFCAGCAWDYSSAETDWAGVDAYEVHTGPANVGGPPDEPVGNPFTPAAIAEWDRLRRRGYRIAAVAASDSHFAGRRPDLLQSETGRGATVVYASELSERGIARGVRAGHAYAKLFGEDSPDLRLTAIGGGRTAMMGDSLRAERATLLAAVMGGKEVPQPRTLVLLRDGQPIETVPVSGRRTSHRFRVAGPGEYRIQVMRGDLVDALTNPIRLGPPGG